MYVALPHHSRITSSTQQEKKNTFRLIRALTDVSQKRLQKG